MREPRNELLPTTTLGQYEIHARIGSGGMGDVYDATHTGLHRRVAIKTLRRRFLDDDTVVARFLREGQLASRIRHPNIVDVTDVGIIGGLPCLVMEHLEGEPLGAVLKRDGALPLTTLVDLLLPIVAAVEFAHERGVLHRDIKPSNIFLARSWNGDLTPKILDFGISKLIDQSHDAALTTDSAFVGTPHYASPELMRADQKADGRSDEYSMGVVLYEGATGAKPFAEKGGSFVSLAMAICGGEFPPPRVVKADIPAAFEAVILKAMSLEPADRYPSMRALGHALLPFASERARLIWAPTFASAGPADDGGDGDPRGTPQEGTQVLLRPSTSVASLGTTGPPAGYPALSVGMTPTSGVMPMSSHQSSTPAGQAYDRSYSFGGGSLAATPPKKSSSALMAGVIGFALAVLVAGVAIVRFSGKGSEGAAGDGPNAAPSEATIPTSYKVTIKVMPDGATFELDGIAAGSGALERTFPRDGRSHALRVSAPGYETVLLEFDDSHPPPANLVLRAVASASPKGPATPGPTRGTHGVSSSGGGRPAGTGKNPDNRPRTDNIDPWE